MQVEKFTKVRFRHIRKNSMFIMVYDHTALLLSCRRNSQLRGSFSNNYTAVMPMKFQVVKTAQIVQILYL